jgi:beta-glucosidase
MKFSLSICLLLIGYASQLTAQEEVLATKPVVQDAAWAKKWWMPRHEQKLADLKKQDKVDLLFVGDSITHGFEGGGKATWEKHYAPRNAFNIGFSGDRTEHVLWRLQNGAVKGISPKLCVIMIGTNNTGHRKENPDHTAAGIKMIVDELLTRIKGTKILLLAIFPRDEKPDGQYRVINDGVNKIIKGYASKEKGVTYLDISDKFLDDEGVLSKEIMPDMLHPNTKGYEIWADSIEPTIQELMGETSE